MSGDQVLIDFLEFLGPTVRAFGQEPFATGVTTPAPNLLLINPWFRQQFLLDGHNAAAGRITEALNHLQTACAQLGC